MNTTPNLTETDAFTWAAEYLNRGHIVEVYEKSKSVKGPRTKRVIIEGLFDLENYHFTDRTCVGIVMDPIHTCADADATEAIALAPYYLPPTEMISGRPGREDSHWWYRLEEIDPDTKGTKFLDPATLSTENPTIVEFFHATGGKAIHMVICPPSPYDDRGKVERAEWSVLHEPAILKADAVYTACGILASAVILARCWNEGQRNELTIAMCGALTRSGWSPEDIASFLRPIAQYCHDDEWDNRVLQPAVTSSRSQSGGTTYGWPQVGNLIGEPRAKRLQEWLSFKTRQAKKSAPASASLPPLEIANTVYEENQNRFRYVTNLRSWAIYETGVWVIDYSAELKLQHTAIETRERMAAQVKSQTQPLSWKAISEALSMLRTFPSLQVTVDDFDDTPTLLNGPHGTHDLQRQVLVPSDPNHSLSRQMPTPFDASATCPEWEKQMELVFPDREIREYIQRAFGYTLQGTQAERCFFLLHGEGRNGKSLMLRTIEMVLGCSGQGYAQQVNTATFVRAATSEINSGLAKLRGVRLASIGEFPQRNMNAELIKTITGGESNTSRQLYERTAEFPFQCKLWFTSNNKPGPTESTDMAFWSRMHAIPCTTQFPEPDEPGNIAEAIMLAKFAKEASGILNWLLEGYRMWAEDGLKMPDKLRRARDEYRAEIDLVEQFLEEESVHVHPMAKTIPQDVGWTNLTDFWEVFDSWATRNGEDKHSRNQSLRTRMGLRRALEQKGFTVSGVLDEDTKQRGQLRVYGIDLDGISQLAS
jgi:P4 family phage/plasmid primase-like protien